MAKPMTKANSKRAASAFVGALMLASSVLPAFAREMPATGTEQTGAGACTRYVQVVTNLKSRLDEQAGKLTERRDERQSKLKELRADHESKVQDRRTKWAENWDRLVAKLQSQAQNDPQKAAIAAFKAAMEAAFKTRQAAVDAANQAFRAGLDASVTAKKTAVAAAVAAYKSSVLAALNKAKSDCAAGVPSATVRANLRTALDAAHVKLQADIKAIHLIDGKAADLAKTRQAAIEKANADFKAAAEKARADLKAALKAAAPASATGTKETEDKHGDEDQSATEGQE